MYLLCCFDDDHYSPAVFIPLIVLTLSFFAWKNPSLYRDMYVLNAFQLKRIYSFDIIPPKLFARVMRRLLTHFTLGAAEEIRCIQLLVTFMFIFRSPISL
jgi:hypothetical protein